MSKLTTCEMVVARANNRPSQEELIKDYYSYGKIGKEIIKMINQFDDLNPHDQLAKDYIKEYYKFLKKVSSSRIQINKWIELINSLQSETSWIEYKFSDNSIINEKPNYSFDENRKTSINNAFSVEEILDEIVYQTRTILIGKEHDYNKLLNMNLANYCELSTNFIIELANKYNIEAKSIKIFPAFSQNPPLYETEMNNHYFAIINIDDEYYLIDCTYSQFFSWYRNHIERLGTYSYNGCSLGVYMLKDLEREKVARTILKKGWIKLTEENLKHYLDGFTLYYRNGLYYENLGVADYKVDYNIDTYINFLFGDDSQIKHESRRFLGYQYSPLKNRNLKF